MTDYGMTFERVVKKFLGKPKTPIYFASYFGDNFETKALLFAICVSEININKDKYSEDELFELKVFEKKLSRTDVKYSEIIKCIKYLHEN